MALVTEKMIVESPDGTIWIFGDNLLRIGLGGQAKIARKFVASGKAFGIPTKRSPGTYFHDQLDESEAVVDAFMKIQGMIHEGKKIIFFPNIGRGLARMEEMSPSILGYIRGSILDLVSAGLATEA